MKNPLLLFTIVLLGSFTAHAQSAAETDYSAGLQSITQADAKAHISVLAADSLQGREAGTVYARKAAVYIVQQLQKTGIIPLADNNYLQCFAYPYKKYNSAEQRVENDTVNLCNILGMIKGADTTKYVFIGAHYDHVGTNNDLQPDSIFNGADDNASGVAGVLQIAKAFMASGKQPAVNVVFAFWDGEEMGLFGSRWFMDSCSYANCIKGYVNLDMIGRSTNPNRPNFVYYYYKKPRYITWLKEDIERYNLTLDPEYMHIDFFSYGSDHMPFMEKRVPVIYYFTGLHPDYHKVGDEADKIDWDLLETITKAAFLSVWNWVDAPLP